VNSAHRRAILLTIGILTATSGAYAQEQPKPPSPPPPVAAAEEQAKPERGFFKSLFHNLGDDIKHIPRKNSLYWLAAGSVLAGAIHPADDDIKARLQGSDTADKVFKPGKFLGSSYTIGAEAVTLYLIGRHGEHPRAKHLGMDLIEATILSEGLTQLIKVAVRRERPIAPDGTQASGYSFPSGHATVTFAAATVLQQHLGWKAAVPTYLVASYVAMSRLVETRHWASDFMFGAADGIIIGRSVTWHGRNFYASPMLLPHGGAGVMVSIIPSGSSTHH
jgi:hypothetical protein